MDKLLKGQTVMIYEEPLTETKPEGKAKLIKLVSKENIGGTETWEVKFLSDGFKTTRKIKV